MSKQFNIAVDAMGGDNAPEKVIAGVIFFLSITKKITSLLIYMEMSPTLKKQLINIKILIKII